MTIQSAIAAVQDAMLTLSVRAAPDYAPEQINVFPFVVVYPGPAEITPQSAGLQIGLYTIIVEVHVKRSDLSRDIADVIGFADSIPAKLLSDITLSGTVQTFRSITMSGLTALGWGGIQTIGFRFTLNGVKFLM